MVSFDTFNCNWLWYLFDVLAMLLVMCIITILPGSVPVHHWMLIPGSCLAYLVHSTRWWVLFLSLHNESKAGCNQICPERIFVEVVDGILSWYRGKGDTITVNDWERKWEYCTKSTRLHDNNRPMFVAYLLAGKWEEGTFYYYNIY